MGEERGKTCLTHVCKLLQRCLGKIGKNRSFQQALCLSWADEPTESFSFFKILSRHSAAVCKVRHVSFLLPLFISSLQVFFFTLLHKWCNWIAITGELYEINHLPLRYLGCLPGASFSNQNNALVFFQQLHELSTVLPHRQCSSFPQEFMIPIS